METSPHRNSFTTNSNSPELTQSRQRGSSASVKPLSQEPPSPPSSRPSSAYKARMRNAANPSIITTANHSTSKQNRSSYNTFENLQRGRTLERKAIIAAQARPNANEAATAKTSLLGQSPPNTNSIQNATIAPLSSPRTSMIRAPPKRSNSTYLSDIIEYSRSQSHDYDPDSIAINISTPGSPRSIASFEPFSPSTPSVTTPARHALHHLNPIDLIALSPDGTVLSSFARKDGVVIIWTHNSVTHRLDPKFQYRTPFYQRDHAGPRSSGAVEASAGELFLAVSNGGQYLALSSCVLNSSIPGRPAQIRASTSNPDDSFLLLSTSHTASFVPWLPSAAIFGIPEFISGNRFAIASSDRVHIYDTNSWVCIQMLDLNVLVNHIGGAWMSWNAFDQVQFAVSFLRSGCIGWVEQAGGISLWKLDSLLKEGLLQHNESDEGAQLWFRILLPKHFRDGKSVIRAALSPSSPSKIQEHVTGLGGGEVFIVYASPLEAFEESGCLLSYLTENGVQIARRVIEDRIDFVGFLEADDGGLVVTTLGTTGDGENVVKFWDPYTLEEIGSFSVRGRGDVENARILPWIQAAQHGPGGWFAENLGRSLFIHSASLYPTPQPDSLVRLIPSHSFTNPLDTTAHLTSALQPAHDPIRGKSTTIHYISLPHSSLILTPEPWLTQKSTPDVWAHWVDHSRVIVIGEMTIQLWSCGFDDLAEVGLQYIWATPPILSSQSSAHLSAPAFYRIQEVAIESKNENKSSIILHLLMTAPSEHNTGPMTVRQARVELPLLQTSQSVFSILHNACRVVRMLREVRTAVGAGFEEESVVREVRRIVTNLLEIRPGIFSRISGDIHPVEDWLLLGWDDLVDRLLILNSSEGGWVPCFHHLPTYQCPTQNRPDHWQTDDFVHESAITLAVSLKKPTLVWQLIKYMVGLASRNSGYMTTFVDALPLLLREYPDYVDVAVAELLNRMPPATDEISLDLLPTEVVNGVFERSSRETGCAFAVEGRLKTIKTEATFLQRLTDAFSDYSLSEQGATLVSKGAVSHPAALYILPLPGLFDVISSNAPNPPVTVTFLSRIWTYFPQQSKSLFTYLALHPTIPTRPLFRHRFVAAPLIDFKWRSFARARLFSLWCLSTMYLALYAVAVTMKYSIYQCIIMIIVLILSGFFGFKESKLLNTFGVRGYIGWVGNWVHLAGLVIIPAITALEVLWRGTVVPEIAVIGVLLMWVNFILQLRINKPFGIFLYRISNITRTLVYFILLLGVLIIGFSHAFYLVLGNSDLVDTTSERNTFSTFRDSVVHVLGFLTGNLLPLRSSEFWASWAHSEINTVTASGLLKPHWTRITFLANALFVLLVFTSLLLIFNLIVTLLHDLLLAGNDLAEEAWYIWMIRTIAEVEFLWLPSTYCRRRDLFPRLIYYEDVPLRTKDLLASPASSAADLFRSEGDRLIEKVEYLLERDVKERMSPSKSESVRESQQSPELDRRGSLRKFNKRKSIFF